MGHELPFGMESSKDSGRERHKDLGFLKSSYKLYIDVFVLLLHETNLYLVF